MATTIKEANAFVEVSRPVVYDKRGTRGNPPDSSKAMKRSFLRGRRLSEPLGGPARIARNTAATGAIMMLVPVLLFTCHPCWAQSTVVRLPGAAESETDLAAESTLAASYESFSSLSHQKRGITNSLSAALRRSEQMLDAATPSAWRKQTTLGDLVDKMRRQGMQVLVDMSVTDNGVSEDSSIRLALQNASIGTNLRFALMAFDCDYLIKDTGVIQLLSIDEILAIEHFTIATYEIGKLASNFENAFDVGRTIQESIDPDSWEENGGSGRINILPSKRGYLLTISHSYQTQRQVRQLLHNLLVLGGGESMGDFSSIDTGLASSPVRLPEEYLALRRNRRGMALPGSGTTGGFGGGSGLGGGVF